MEGKIKHLEFVQGVINRMAKNSFMLKGWAVSLFAGIFTLASKDSNNLLCLAGISVIVFWFLDSYYLLQERLYRSLYEKVRQTDEDKIDFSLKATTTGFDTQENCFYRCLFSKTELFFYVFLIVCVIAMCFM